MFLKWFIASLTQFHNKSTWKQKGKGKEQAELILNQTAWNVIKKKKKKFE